MIRLMRSALILGASLILGGCYTHNFPLRDETFIQAAGPVPTARVYVDANGTFFPDNWRPHRDNLGLFLSWPGASLLNQAERQPSFGPLLRLEQERQLAELARFIAGKRRLFIFIHGFNNNQPETDRPYRMMAERIAFEPGDGLIMFHWDGFDGRFPGSPGLFWWWAVANSQMAGTHALRQILDLTGDTEEVILISHSRGASVILSAFSDPPYAEDFRRRTADLPFAARARLLDPPALAEGPRNVHAIMMAPAIGRVDFLTPDCVIGFDRNTRPSCDLVRRFPRLASIDYTLNPCDEVLEKIIGLSNRFNPTDFGLVPEVGARLAGEIESVAMRPHRIQAPHNHDFPLYTADPEFSAMLLNAGATSRLWPTPPAPERCRRARREPGGR